MDQQPATAATVALLDNHVQPNETKFLWVFGYGSLCWMPGFDFHKAVIGHVPGYARRFWQGNITHRGTEGKPGRVATLVQKTEGKVHGVAFAISGEAALRYLSNRECELGGYISHFAEFQPANGDPFNVLLYIATPQNVLWMGDAAPSVMADEIVSSSGPSGHNVEYVLRLSNFMRSHFPSEHDEHLFGLEKEVVERIQARSLCLRSLMGDGRGCLSFVKADGNAGNEVEDGEREEERVENFQHTARMPEKSLRCLNI